MADNEASLDTTLAKLVSYYENSSDAMRDSDELSERDRDYYDNKQLTAAEQKELRDRGQPDVIKNRIKPKVDFLLGTERANRTDPKAYPRTPMDEGAANAATDAIRYVADREDFPAKRSTVFENITIEGTGGAIVEVQEKGGKRYICIKRIAWDRLFYDHHSRERDFYDALFKGLIWWGDQSEAEALYPEASVDSLFEQSLRTTGTQTRDDKPSHWVDGKRKRVMFAEIYYRERGVWMHAIYTKAGFIKEPHVSEYVDDEGDPCCPLEFMSCYVDRQNNRYGVVRQLIGPQDEINKRSSKALHLLTMRQFKMEKGAGDTKSLKKELSKPDGVAVVNPGMMFELLNTNDMAQGNIALLQEAKQEIDATGPSAALAGKDNSTSGKELALKQAGGLTELGPVFDSLRQWQRNIYKQIWFRIKQYWDQETWVRVTDDENAPRFVGLNIGPPGQKVNEVAKMDLDIILDESPDTVTVQQEQFATLGELYKVNPQTPVNPTGVPFDVVFEASQVRNKQKILDRMRGVQQPPQMGPDGQPMQPQQGAPMGQPMPGQPGQPPMPGDPQGGPPPPPDPMQVIGQIMEQAVGQLQQIGQQIAQGVQQAGQEAVGAIQQQVQQVEQAAQQAATAVQQAGLEAVNGVQNAAGQAVAQVSGAATANGMQAVVASLAQPKPAQQIVRDAQGRAVGIVPVQ